MESKEKILASLNILKRLPPTQMQKNVSAIANLIPDQAEELYQRIDKPLSLKTDDQGQAFIQSEFNRDGDSYRSPNDNRYYPELQDALFPSEQLRKLEIKANIVFAEYLKLYYEGGHSNCYFWDQDNGFASAWLVRKDVTGAKNVKEGSWSSINVIDVRREDKKWKYKLTTSVVLDMKLEEKFVGSFDLAGSLVKTKEETVIIPDKVDIDLFHLEKIGSLIEEQESQIRSNLDTLYVGKTKDVVFATRYFQGEKQYQQQRQALAGEFKQKYN
ncbi:hypothetical protein pb186bvf_007710 [Paramecium bursaria]